MAQVGRHDRAMVLPEWRLKLAVDVGRALALGAQSVQPLLRAFDSIRVPAVSLAVQVRHTV
jgi:hypothetical protein